MTLTLTYEQIEEALLGYLHTTGDLPLMEGPVSLDMPFALDDDGMITIGLDVVGEWETPVEEAPEAGVERFLRLV